MSREIKFRVYDQTSKDHKVYGIGEVVDEHFGLGIISRIVWWLKDIKHKFIIEQYTGLKDKNGKEIYEGDILQTCCGKAEVYFDDELLMYRIKVRHGGTMPLVSKKSKRHFDYTIIGNVHENPELLGG
ncbi:hypothetical protein J6S35_00580 [Candidatus Saccharibacteria bacterium]|nr:hypothetical protein [Candidatus Saccharibacteria bacterium]